VRFAPAPPPALPRPGILPLIPVHRRGVCVQHLDQYPLSTCTAPSDCPLRLALLSVVVVAGRRRRSGPGPGARGQGPPNTAAQGASWTPRITQPRLVAAATREFRGRGAYFAFSMVASIARTFDFHVVSFSPSCFHWSTPKTRCAQRLKGRQV
jgi:hypothetical protein